jgi:lipid A 3-O-deacylase PagL
VRLAYRRTLPNDSRWWIPTLVELGGGIWRVPDFAGTTQRFDLHATPVWRGDFARTYVEGGIGVYLLSHIINNDTTHMSTSFEFGSHIGAGLRFGERGETRCTEPEAIMKAQLSQDDDSTLFDDEMDDLEAWTPQDLDAHGSISDRSNA